MGLPGFEPGSREPKSPSLGQTSRQPLLQSLEPLQTINDFGLILKTLSKPQHLSKDNQKAIWNRLTFLEKHVNLLVYWFATMTYIKTRDIFHVKYVLGHRRLENTLKYVHLAEGLASFPGDYTCEIAKTVQEAAKLMEQGFDYVCDVDGV
jgi:hypothetical protein